MTSIAWYIALCASYSLAALQVYAIYSFRRIQWTLIISKRYPRLVYAKTFIVLIWLVLGLPYISNKRLSDPGDVILEEWSFIIEGMIQCTCAHLAVGVEVVRLWLISFDLHYLQSSQNEQWKSQIDESFAKKDWYLKNRNKYGNEKYILMRFFVYYIFIAITLSIIYIVCFMIQDEFDNALFIAANVDGMIMSAEIFFIFYLYWKGRKFHELGDNLLFYYEARADAMIWGFGLFLFFIYLPMEYVFKIVTISNPLYLVVATFVLNATTLLSSLWIPRKISKDKMWNVDAFSPQISALQFTEDETMGNILDKTLANKEKFELFIQSMYKEFSAEAGLCFIEMVQFRQSLIAYLKKRGQKFEDEFENLLYDSVPKSSIVFAGASKVDGIAKYEGIAHRLFKKYIRQNAEFEINISYAMRAEFTRIDEKGWDMAPMEFVTVFDKVIKEMMNFMRQSFFRYKERAEDRAEPSDSFNNIGAATTEDPYSLNLDENEIKQEIPSNNLLTTKKLFQTQQHCQGIPIFNAMLVIEMDEDKINKKPIIGHYYDCSQILSDIESSTPLISEDDALSIITNKLNITANDIYGNVSTNINFYFMQKHKQFYLTYIIKFKYYNITNPNDLYWPMSIINSANGDILQLFNEPRSYTIEACGPGGNGKIGKYEYCKNGRSGPTIKTTSNVPVLENDDIQVYDNENYAWNDDQNVDMVRCPKLSNSQCEVDEGTTNGAYGVAIDVFNYLMNTWDMYDEYMNEPPVTWPRPFPIYVHVGSNWGNANFAGDEINFGDGGSSWYPLGTLSIAAHEIAHGYTDRKSNLIYAAESGGMNEAYSDIVGESAKYYVRGSNDWKTGFDVYKSANGALRYMYNPPLDGRSIDHSCDMYNDIDVHYSSGLYNKAAYLMNTNSDYPFSMEQIFKVFSTANSFFWSASSTFNEGVCGLIQALDYLYDGQTYNNLFNTLQSSFAQVGLSCNYYATPDCGTLGTLCGTNPKRFCYFEDVAVSTSNAISYSVTLQAYDDDEETRFLVDFTIKNYDCINPRLSFEHEGIDLDQLEYSEWIEVYDNGYNGGRIKRCQLNEYYCNQMVSCINGYSLNNGNKILKNTVYTIEIVEGYGVDAVCDTWLSFNAKLTLNCDKATTTKLPTPSPTNRPSSSPIPSPTNIPSLSPIPAPTNNPTPSPTSDPTQTPTNNPTVNPTKNPTQNPTLNPSLVPTVSPSNNPTAYPTKKPTATPTNGCVSGNYAVLDTSSLDNWERKVEGATLTDWTIITINDFSRTHCFARNPCIRVTGITGSTGLPKIWIEQRLDTSQYDTLKIGYDAKTRSFDNNDEKGFIETECDGDIEMETFNAFTTGTYSGCLIVATPCNELVVRIGAFMNSAGDQMYITQIVLEQTTPFPSTFPTLSPTISGTSSPTTNPTHLPTDNPSFSPSMSPINMPSQSPSNTPTFSPTLFPTILPSAAPSDAPSFVPSQAPSTVPTASPSMSPTNTPTLSPSETPTSDPTFDPTNDPSAIPTIQPTAFPSQDPSIEPTYHPTDAPSNHPTIDPTQQPSSSPTSDPTMQPTSDPTIDPSANPTIFPTIEPTAYPTLDPTTNPTSHPTSGPSAFPTNDPSEIPTANPTYTLSPSIDPTMEPTYEPTVQPSIYPSNRPTIVPTSNPTNYPTIDPSMEPSTEPTDDPTSDPTNDPSNRPTRDPTIVPTSNPTQNPSANPTHEPTIYPTHDPSIDPTTDPSANPTSHPSNVPSYNPTIIPTSDPSVNPTSNPTNNPSSYPSSDPTLGPSDNPTTHPTIYPTIYPTVDPTMQPTINPSLSPTAIPTLEPIDIPTNVPSSEPTFDPTVEPTTSDSEIQAADIPSGPSQNDDEATATSSETSRVVTLVVVLITMFACTCLLSGFVMLACLGFKRQVYNLKKTQVEKQSSPSPSPRMHTSAPRREREDGISIGIGTGGTYID